MTTKRLAGRPTKINSEVLSKLDDALQYGATVSEACYVAGISRDTFYRYYQSEKDFVEQMEGSRARLSKRARENIALAIENGDIELSKWLLDKKIIPAKTIADEVTKPKGNK